MVKHKGIFRTRHKIGPTPLYAKRNTKGRFVDIQSVKRAMAGERKKRGKTIVRPGYGFRGETTKK